jgi:hypothetical protein
VLLIRCNESVDWASGFSMDCVCQCGESHSLGYSCCRISLEHFFLYVNRLVTTDHVLLLGGIRDFRPRMNIYNFTDYFSGVWIYIN